MTVIWVNIRLDGGCVAKEINPITSIGDFGATENREMCITLYQCLIRSHINAYEPYGSGKQLVKGLTCTGPI